MTKQSHAAFIPAVVKLLSVLLLTSAFLLAPGSPALTAGDGLPAPVRAVLAKAGAMMNEDRYTDAIDILNAFIARTAAPEKEARHAAAHHAEILYTLGTCYLLTGDCRQAVKALEDAVKRDPGHRSAWANLGKAAYDLDDYHRAATAFDQAFSGDPDASPDYLYYSGVAFLLAGDHDSAINQFERLLASFPGRIENTWLEQYVHALLAAGRSRQALPQIRHLAGAFTGDKQLQWQEMLLHLYLQLEMLAEARDYACLLTESAPTQVKWWKARAHIHLQDGAYQPALAALVISSYLEPLSEQETKIVADLFLQLGIPSQAAPRYRRLLKDDDRQVLLNLVVALRQLDRNEQALEEIEACTAQSEDPRLLAHRADLLYELQRYEEAALLYRRLAERDGKQHAQAARMAEYATLLSEQQTSKSH
ncbi:tetratricopeptide repeat protein [Desulfofustis glycolicus]|uniref:tetratricopeptide repeat protein n=1 Tax=Desulfofustis glycolicus TaxID=51195 RepID=UPI0009349229|nr:tetratricopeptide repeat protein [Desulfofustis glycolicus]MCB2215557.1 tetratricopeptide repeat protein [Desulfobulbaceae bacterium]